ncbi:hypothetical protein ACFLZV_02200 [Candidatus Margulisiibacteriota bacterium]
MLKYKLLPESTFPNKLICCFPFLSLISRRKHNDLFPTIRTLIPPNCAIPIKYFEVKNLRDLVSKNGGPQIRIIDCLAYGAEAVVFRILYKNQSMIMKVYTDNAQKNPTMYKVKYISEENIHPYLKKHIQTSSFQYECSLGNPNIVKTEFLAMIQRKGKIVFAKIQEQWDGDLCYFANNKFLCLSEKKKKLFIMHLIRDISRALSTIHGKNKTFFDLKPHNIAVKKNKNNKNGQYTSGLFDFGSITNEESLDNISNTDHLFTVFYAAPNVLLACLFSEDDNDVSVKINKATDLFSLFLIVLELASETEISKIYSMIFNNDPSTQINEMEFINEVAKQITSNNSISEWYLNKLTEYAKSIFVNYGSDFFDKIILPMINSSREEITAQDLFENINHSIDNCTSN